MTDVSNEMKNHVGRAYHMLKNLDAFNEKEVRGVALGQTNSTLRESCFLGNYLRSIANVKTLLKLGSIEDSQVVATIARSIFEMAVEIHLIDCIPDSPSKIIAFGELERLKRARKIVKFTETHPNHSPRLDDPLFKSFIDREGSRIESNSNRLWPNKKIALTHWSQLNLRQRAELIGDKILEMYDSEYQMHSWYVHAGITGVINTEPEFYWVLCGVALVFAADSFELILGSVIRLCNLEQADAKIWKKLECSKMLSFTESDAQATELWRQALGFGATVSLVGG